MSAQRIAYKVEDAAEQVSQSVSTIRKAIKTTDPAAHPPPLPATFDGKKYLVLHTDLEAWVTRLNPPS